jgi:hypothetical protein
MIAMKKTLIAVLLIIISFSMINAQIPIAVSEDSIKIGKNLLPGFSVNIPECDYNKVLDIWKRELQSGTKSKVVTENNEMTIFGANLKNLTPNPVNVYSSLVRLDSMLMLYVSLEKKKDEYIERSSSVAEFIKVKDYLKQFAKDRYTEVAKGQADAEDKKLYNLQRELSSLENEKSRMLKSIFSDSTEIIAEQNNIVVQNEELRKVEEALKEQNTLLEKTVDGAARKDISEQIKELEKRKKKAISSVGSSENKISKAKNSMEKTRNEIPVNEQKQIIKIEQVSRQEAISMSYAAKLKKIQEL